MERRSSRAPESGWRWCRASSGATAGRCGREASRLPAKRAPPSACCWSRTTSPLLQGFERWGRFACVAVTDTGDGLDAATLGRVFEPFYTTKPVGVGTGLGLAMVFGLMKQHRGFVHMYSEPGLGTTARLYFPAVAEAVAAPAAAQRAASRGTETLLLVEDQEMLRRATLRTLRKLGYTVLTACDGLEGLRALSERRGEIALVTSDVVMPNMGGVELYREARGEGVTAPFLLTSGYTGRPSADAIPPEIALIEKPWSVEALSQKVRDLIDGHQSK